MTRDEAETIARLVKDYDHHEMLLTELQEQFPAFDWLELAGLFNGKHLHDSY